MCRRQTCNKHYEYVDCMRHVHLHIWENAFLGQMTRYSPMEKQEHRHHLGLDLDPSSTTITGDLPDMNELFDGWMIATATFGRVNRTKGPTAETNSASLSGTQLNIAAAV